MLGVKLAKLPLLKGLFDEESKQKRKLSRATLGARSEDLLEWLKLIPDLRTYISGFQEKGATGAQLAQAESDAQLIEYGINSEVDRKCLLLQLARVRERSKHQACAEGIAHRLRQSLMEAARAFAHRPQRVVAWCRADTESHAYNYEDTTCLNRYRA